jgi:hypothetical protein
VLPVSPEWSKERASPKHIKFVRLTHPRLRARDGEAANVETQESTGLNRPVLSQAIDVRERFRTRRPSPTIAPPTPMISELGPGIVVVEEGAGAPWFAPSMRPAGTLACTS